MSRSCRGVALPDATPSTANAVWLIQFGASRDTHRGVESSVTVRVVNPRGQGHVRDVQPVWARLHHAVESSGGRVRRSQLDGRGLERRPLFGWSLPLRNHGRWHCQDRDHGGGGHSGRPSTFKGCVRIHPMFPVCRFLLLLPCPAPYYGGQPSPITREGWLANRSPSRSRAFAERAQMGEGWRRRPDLNRGWRFCRFRKRGHGGGFLAFWSLQGLGVASCLGGDGLELVSTLPPGLLRRAHHARRFHRFCLPPFQLTTISR